ncbi:CoA-dependent acyltransferase [Hymenopellis radicata]|nr:CoA-dependent acyltransferase [Hymenopellis radicata]
MYRRLLLRRPLLASRLHTSSVLFKSLRTFKLADIGEGITECEVIKWSVEAKSTVQAFDPLCEVQSDKASVEITSPFDGVVVDLLVKEGDIAKVGSGLCTIEVDEDDNDAADKVEPEPSTPVQAKQPEPEPSPPVSRRDDRIPWIQTTPRHVLATPSVRHYARQNSVDLAQVTPGSGRDGRVEKKDVDAFLTGKSPRASSFVPTEQDTVVELTRTRHGMWKAMVKSLEVPHFGYSTSLDITSLYELIPTLNAHIPEHFRPVPSTAPPPLPVDPSSIYPAPHRTRVPEEKQFTRLTYLPILLKMLAKSMIEWPLFRSSITPSQVSDAKPTLTVRPHADINIALSTPSGLYTPTLQGVDTQTIYGLASSLKHLSHLGRQTPCALTPKEMPKRGGTLTVSNVGAIGDGDYASPVLVPGGGVAIVALGRAKWVWDVNRGDGKGERRLKLGVSWSGDHRVVEGAELAAFVECWRSYVENPARLIADSV